MSGTISATVIQSRPSMKLTRLTNQTPAMTSSARSSHQGRNGVIWKSAGRMAITIATATNWTSRRGATGDGADVVDRAEPARSAWSRRRRRAMSERDLRGPGAGRGEAAQRGDEHRPRSRRCRRPAASGSCARSAHSAAPAHSAAAGLQQHDQDRGQRRSTRNDQCDCRSSAAEIRRRRCAADRADARRRPGDCLRPRTWR